MEFAFHRLGQPKAAHAAHGPHPPLDAPGDYATMFDPALVDDCVAKLVKAMNAPEARG
jgi:hypothetical protein